jgi:hypothetical protein
VPQDKCTFRIVAQSLQSSRLHHPRIGSHEVAHLHQSRANSLERRSLLLQAALVLVHHVLAKA